MDRKAVVALLERRAYIEGGQQKAADKLKVSGGYFSDVLHGRREPGDKILRALGLRRVVQYEAR